MRPKKTRLKRTTKSSRKTGVSRKIAASATPAKPKAKPAKSQKPAGKKKAPVRPKPVAPKTRKAPGTKPAVTPRKRKPAAPSKPVVSGQPVEPSQPVTPSQSVTPSQPVTPPVSKPQPVQPAPSPLPFKIPPILLEGDEPVRPPVSGPGQKYLLAPTPVPPTGPEGEAEVPDVFGTGELLLTPRDPHCLYAQWDIDSAQQRRYNQLSRHHHLLVRVHADRIEGEIISEMHVHPESRYWFIHVPAAEATYVAELGLYQGPRWERIALSAPATTPGSTVSEDRSVRFVTIPLDQPLAPVPVPVEPPAPAHEPAAEPTLVKAPPRVEQPSPAAPSPAPPVLVAEPAPAPVAKTEPQWFEPRPTLPGLPVLPGAAAEWTPEKETLLQELVARSFVRQEWIGSIELETLIREQEQKPLRPPGEELGSIAAAQLGAPTSPGAPEAIASPGPLEVAPGQPAKPGQAFWFKVNAELIVYGATEPDAVVTIGGRQIRLRPDGTFSYRFALPDGTYQLPIQAVAVHGDQRRADLSFYRGTRYEGEVGAQAQKPGLQAPAPQNVT